MADLTGDTINDINLTNTMVGAVPTLTRVLINGAVFQINPGVNSGTGGYNTFLALSDNNDAGSWQQGFNSNDANPLDATNYEIDASKTKTVQLNSVPITVGTGTGPGGNGGEIGVQYYEIRLDLNESNSTPFISLDQFKIYLSSSSTIESTAGLNALPAANLVYDMDAGGNISVLLRDGNSGSGVDDYVFLIPVSNFAGFPPATTTMYLFTELGHAGNAGTTTGNTTWSADGGFEEFNLQNAVSLSGVKFSDLNSNGLKDGADTFVGGVTINLYEDTNSNGTLDAGDALVQTTVTTAGTGAYSFFGAKTGLTYFVDEVNPAGSVQTTGNFETVIIPGNATGGSAITVDPIGNHYFLPSVTIDKAFSNVTDGPDGGNTTGSTTVIDGAGDIANYTIAVFNNGETALTGVTVTDSLATAGAVAVLKTGGFNSGDTDSDGVLDVGETWRYTATQTATQADLDSNGGGDGDKDNSATVVATQQGTSVTVTATDAAAAPIVPSAALAISKVFAGFTGGDGDSLGDFVGDIANYTIVVTNTGNVTLTDVVVTDPLTGNTYNVGTLAPGGSSTLTELYTITQADLDGGGKAGTDHDIDNTATATSTQTGPASASAVAPLVYAPSLAIDKVFINVTAGDGDTLADAVGDVLNYTVAVTNTGNVTLTNVTVVDPLTGQSISGVTLAPGATNTYNTSYTLTQADLDRAGNAGSDGDIDNTATADSNETGPSSDSAVVPLVYAPSIAIDKTFVGWADGGANGNAVGDVANYTVRVTNTGNVTLTNVTVVDPLTGQNISGVTLAPGATSTYNTSYTLTQADLDNNGGGDADIDNTATTDSDQTGPQSDSAFAPILATASVDLEKLVSTTGGANLANYIDADTAAAGFQNVGVQQDMFFAITAQNTGNVTLTNVVITDVSTAYGGASKVLFTGGSLTADAIALGATLSGDTDSDGQLDVGESWTILYKQGFEFGQHINTASITNAQDATDSDLAFYYGIQGGPGVRTPGFWSNLGGQFWDGIGGNETKSGPTFTQNGDLLIYGNTNGTVDSNGDGVINTADKGLLIGDFNRNGITDAGEDTLFIGLSDAKNLINSSLKSQSGDGVQKLGRDAVASWLNFLAGNPIGASSDTASPKHFIEDAVNWLQTWGGKAGVNSPGNLADNVKTETFDIYDAAHTAVKTNTPQWNISQFAGDNHSAAQVHGALDYYNNTGQTSPTSVQYAMSADDSSDVMLIMASQVTV